MAQPRKTPKRATKNTSANAGGEGRASRQRKPVEQPGAADDVGRSGEHPMVAMVRGLAEIVETRGLGELIVELPEATVTLRRSSAPSPVAVQPAIPAGPALPLVVAPPPVAPAAPPPQAESRPIAAPAPEPPADDHHVVTSPFVGTFYRRPNPDADTYVEVGARVEKGQVLCIIEAMKLMNEIEADVSGTVVAVLANDSEPVEYGQPLFKIARS
ncbi:MAG TPA: acetyl-CoA carboxylase biotin carboxyl carrier protein [Haliangium sp.]|nr:acetyl-CoA carboxylase biotin carboxyl carrier protein [Haliangium sp.]